jgi:hypothetical protein
MKTNKDCTICIYGDVCSGRRQDKTIIDCCIPEAPLRKMQKHALAISVSSFIDVTHAYIEDHKRKSEYWSEQLGK